MPEGPLRANPPTSDIHLTSRISSWLYAVFAIMVVSAVGMAFLAKSRARGTRVFHQLAVVILTIAAIDYFAMASDLGNTPIDTTMRQRATRAVWYSRYIDWIITTPLLLLLLLLSTGLPLGDIATIIFFDLVMFVCLLIGALVESQYKWFFYAVSLVSLLYIAYHVLVPARASSRLLGVAWGRTYTPAAALLMFTWFLYPVAWALGEGANVYETRGEMIFYSVLDILSKPVFLFMYISRLSDNNYADLGLTSGKYSDPMHSGVAHHNPIGNTVSNAQSSVTAAGSTAGVEHHRRGLGMFGKKKGADPHYDTAAPQMAQTGQGLAPSSAAYPAAEYPAASAERV